MNALSGRNALSNPSRLSRTQKPFALGERLACQAGSFGKMAKRDCSPTPPKQIIKIAGADNTAPAKERPENPSKEDQNASIIQRMAAQLRFSNT
jgi:hypothetical protein